MKRIVILTNIPAPYRVDLFHYLQKNTKEYEIHILYASQNEDNREWETEQSRMSNTHFLDSYTIKLSYRYDIKYIHISKGVAMMLEQIKPAIVVGSEYNPTALQALRYCLKKKIPYISWTDGTLHTERNINWLQKRIRRYVVHHAAACIASSSKSKEAQIAYGAKKESCFISFLTVDLEKYRIQELPREEGRILCVGRLVELKGVDLLLKALAEIEEKYVLVLAGAGPEEENLRKLSHTLGIEDKVEFLGNLSREELKKEYGRCVIFVLPTRQDCFALVMLEAMCAGLPIVGSKYAAGSYDLIKEGENGYIVDPYDKEQLRNCLKELLLNPVKAEQMGQNSLKNLERFRFEQVSRGFWEAFLYVQGLES